MEEEYQQIYSIIERNSIKIGECFGLEKNLQFEEINQHSNEIILSMLVMKNEFVPTRMARYEKRKLLRQDVNLSK